ncbi:hypothetical protein NC653_025608 [Populus alba x Populus x berolinensis]|uniref:RRM domain-containing protein n=1 Tax=Populus alba x Populus x berolinensis TaxID=444605 RepID=A0AAD6ME00_9ROSI|nr:hypothetical protein NC653_025608 [Populus alba x Populus x berolinensis]
MIGECHAHNIIERKGGLVAYQGPRLLGARREVEGLDARRMILCMIYHICTSVFTFMLGLVLSSHYDIVPVVVLDTASTGCCGSKFKYNSNLYRNPSHPFSKERKRDETKQYGGTAASTEEHPIRRTDVKTPLDQAKQKHRSFGFVTLLERDDAVAAMGNMDGAELYGRVLTVNYALPEKIN